MLTGNKGSVEEKRAESSVATFGEESFSFDGSSTLMDTAIKTDEGYELAGGIEAVNVADMRNESSRANGADAGNGLKEFLGFCLCGFESLLCLFESLLKRLAEFGEHAVELLLCCLLIGVLDTEEIGTFSL